MVIERLKMDKRFLDDVEECNKVITVEWISKICKYHEINRNEGSIGELFQSFITILYMNNIKVEDYNNKSESYAYLYIKTIFNDKEFENAMKMIENLINVEIVIVK